MTRGFAHFCEQAAAPVADHIWQSSVVALVASCLTLLLKRNSANCRFNIWFLASIKFFLPFAMLIHLGHALGAGLITVPSRNFALVVELAGQPFGHTRAHLPESTRRDELTGAIPALLGLVWALGVTVAVMVWWLRWLRCLLLEGLRSRSNKAWKSSLCVLCCPRSASEPCRFCS